ncbi:hypothetical protein ACFWCA_19080 [Streptomyces phaeochromogenes]|uniref:hypothetical protein n=1 Tax=Streptomyces phaeochromogenes TaxID=1923 RepID=UPI0036CCD560
MQTATLFDLPAAQTPPKAVRTASRPPLALGELPVSSVPAAYHREHLFSPKAKTAAVVDHRPGDLFPALPDPSREPKAWVVWRRTEASVSTPDFLGLQAGDEITIVGDTAATVVSTCRFGAVVRYALPRSPWATESHAEMYVTSRNQFGHWYR